MDVPALVEQMSEELKHNFEKRARLFSHPGESGEAREAALREILGNYLPGRCGVDTGFVVDSNWNESQQTDIVVYDRNYSPVFEIVDGKRYFPCETVLAVGEVKASIASEQLEDAFAKIESVKTLKRAGAFRISGPGEHFPSSRLERDKWRDQIFGFIFTSDSLTLDNLTSKYIEELSSRDRRLWPNYYCDYNNVNLGYFGPMSEGDEHTLNTNTMTAQGLYTTGSSSPLFGIFHALLTQFISIARMGKPNLLDYYDVQSDIESNLIPI